ncbi:MAG: PGPGW domain-containing protein [Thermodesulfobacteriota bacterium]
MDMDLVVEFFKEYSLLFWLLGSGSLLLLLFSLLVLPLVIIHIPADYFAREKRFSFFRENVSPPISIAWIVLKNLIGAVFVLIGLIMLLTPGQGLITIFIGLLLLNFPGKYRLEKSLIRQRSLFGWMNRLRARFGKPDLEYPED